MTNEAHLAHACLCVRVNTMSDAQSLLHTSLLEYNKADNEVERLLDIIDKATIALENARQSKRTAKIQLDEAINASLRSSSSSAAVEECKDSSYSEYYSSEGESSSQSCSSSGSKEEEEEEEEDRNELDETATSEEDDQFDIADEALEQIRYRLKVAKIDPNSPQGASLLDELLTRLKNNTDDTISDDLIDELMDDLLNNDEGSYDDEEESNNEHNDDDDDEHCEEESHHDESPKRIKISRGGKVLGWYEGGLDDRGYAREGEGTMFYNAGHVYSGYWQDDEMVGCGIYQWADGHVYDVSETLFYWFFCMSCISKASLTAMVS